MPTKKELEERAATKGNLEIVRGFCCQCTNGPHPINCHVVNGVLTKIESNRELGPYIYCPEGRPACPKPNNFIQKVYNPNRVKAPMKRTNPQRGRGIDPGWQEISWEEAFDIVTEKLLAIRKKGLRDENNHPRLGIYAGSDGLSAIVGDAFYAWWSAWGPVDSSFYAGGSIRCYHTEHYYAEMWHRAFICMPDPDRVKWLLSFGRNDYSNWMSTGQTLMDRRKDFKRIQIDPYLSVTGAMSDEWMPIKPLNDYPVILAMIYIILYEMDWREVCDIGFLKKMTNSPYLIGPHGYYVRDPQTKLPLIWDEADGKAKHIDAEGIKDFALEGKYKLKGIEIGPDEETWEVDEGTASFGLLMESMKGFTPEWAAEYCDIRAETIRRLAREYVDNAMIGTTIEMDGETLPFRPVFIGMTKNSSNGPGSYQVELAVHILACLVGSMEVPGGHLSGMTYTAPGPAERDGDGFLEWPFLPTDKENWPWPPDIRCWVRTLCPIVGSSLYSDMLGPNHLTWIGVDEGSLPGGFPVNPPDMLISYKCNPPITVIDSDRIERVLAKIPYHVRIAYEYDETSAFADILLPDNIDVEATQVYLTGSMVCYGEALTDNLLVMGRTPAVVPYNTMDITDICSELAERVGILDKYNESMNNGSVTHGISFQEPYRLKPDKKYTAGEIFDFAARAMTNGEHGLDDFMETGGFAHHVPYDITHNLHYAHPL
ncbi:molybdopterin oxidoreductase, partial [Chloroflexota bacterium]